MIDWAVVIACPCASTRSARSPAGPGVMLRPVVGLSNTPASRKSTRSGVLTLSSRTVIRECVALSAFWTAAVRSMLTIPLPPISVPVALDATAAVASAAVTTVSPSADSTLALSVTVGGGAASPRRTVPAAVPSVDHSSVPLVKKSWEPTAVSCRKPRGAPGTGSVPAGVPSVFQSALFPVPSSAVK